MVNPLRNADAPIRIFIIDDHPTVVWGLERLIESEAPRMAAVGSASTYETAVKALVDTQADVIILDLDLGGASGLQAIPGLRQQSAARILVLTGVREPGAHESAIRAGALGVVGKESDPARLLEAIEKVHRGELTVDGKLTERLLARLAPDAGVSQPSSGDQKVDRLTPRERDIAVALMNQPELALKAVASSLGISERTLRNHLSSIYEKLEISSRLELYVFTSRHRAFRVSS
jgi:DNA-binding NarL/FixJ family response regulator